jgi:hypothetical protein
MFGSKILDVAIGLVFVYIVVSILCTAVREGIEAWLKTRAAYLEHGIRLLLHDEAGGGIAKNIFDHPLIDGLFMGAYKPLSTTTDGNRPVKGGDLPSYIPTKSFANALLDIAARGPANASLDRYNTPISLDAIRRNVVANIPNNPNIQRIVLHAVDAAQGDLDKAQKSIEDWYDSAMDRVSGWYKRTTHFIVLVIGLLIAVGMNVDSLVISEQLYKSDAMREAVVAAASNAADNYNKAANANATETNKQSLDSASLNGSVPAPSANDKGAAAGTVTATSATAASSTGTSRTTPGTDRKGAATSTPTSTTTASTGTSIGTSPKSKASTNEGKGPYYDAKHALDDLRLPVGWNNATLSFCPPAKNQWLNSFVFPWIGWILTALAASLGAPFWFDVLNKFMVIRSTVKPHEKSPEESSEDRQKPGGTTVVVSPGGGSAPSATSGVAVGAAGPGAGNASPDEDADGCDVLQTNALDLTDDSQLPVPQGGAA